MEEIKSIGMIMGQLMRVSQNRMTQLLECQEIHPGQVQILTVLGHHDGLTQKQLGDMLRLKPATISIMLSRMEKTGFLERKADDMDLRLSRVFITLKGRSTAEAARKAIAQVQAEAYSSFTQEELMLMRRLLMQMKDNVESAVAASTKKARH